MPRRRKQVHLGGHFPGVNNHTVWTDSAVGSNIEIDSFVHMAEVSERGLFDMFFLAEGLRLREQRGKIYEFDIMGRPDNFTVLAAIAGVTTRIGLAASINTTFNEPAEVARQFATLDHLSRGRAAWNVVTSSEAFIGANFRRGGYLPHAERYTRAAEFVDVARRFWDGWPPDALVVDRKRGVFAHPGPEIDHSGAHFRIRGEAALPRSRQGHPVLIQAGDSSAGRDFAAAYAEAVFTLHGSLESGQAYYRDVKSRMARYGRSPEHLKILPATTFVLGDTDEEAAERARQVRLQQVSPQTAIATLEQIWSRDLSEYDPDGPLPEIDPVIDESFTAGRVHHPKDTLAMARRYRERAEAGRLSIRELVIEMTAHQQFVGTPKRVAQEIDHYVQSDACDGFMLVPTVNPTGLDEFVDLVVPELQERGCFRTEYRGETLRDHLGLPHPHGRTAARHQQRTEDEDGAA